MKLVLAWVGRTRNPQLQTLQEEYLARLEKFVAVEVVAVRKPNRGSELRRQTPDSLEKKVSTASAVILLDPGGRELTSPAFACFLDRLQVRGTRVVCFVLGGPDGLTEGVRRRADHVLSLSRMTWTHEMARVLLLEQLYRAFTILRGHPYHK